MGLIVEFVGYSSAATTYWRQRRIAFEVAGPVLMITLPTAVLLGWMGSAISDRWLLFSFGLILFGLAFVFLKRALVTMFIFVGFIMIWRSF